MAITPQATYRVELRYRFLACQRPDDGADGIETLTRSWRLGLGSATRRALHMGRRRYGYRLLGVRVIGPDGVQSGYAEEARS